MANAIAKDTNGSSFTTKIPHLEGQEVFGSTKQRANIAPRSEGDSHRHDCVNFSWLKVKAMSSGFAGSNVDVGESSGIFKDKSFVWLFRDWRFRSVCAGMVSRELRSAHHHKIFIAL
jgi:hypothetical protein